MTRSLTVVVEVGVLVQAGIDVRLPPAGAASACPASSAPTTDSSATLAPSAATLRATLAAPPRRSSDALDLHHRHRRLGRDAADLAEPVAVQHDVADHQHAGGGGVGDGVADCRGHGRRPIGKYSMPRLRHARRIVQVAAVEDHRRLEACA